MNIFCFKILNKMLVLAIISIALETITIKDIHAAAGAGGSEPPKSTAASASASGRLYLHGSVDPTDTSVLDEDKYFKFADYRMRTAAQLKSSQYAVMEGLKGLYAAPLFHAYHGASDIRVPLLVSLDPAETFPHLPSAIQHALGGLAPNDVFCIVTIVKELSAGSSLLEARPHTWLDPYAPRDAAGYSKQLPFHIGIFDPMPASLRLEGRVNELTGPYNAHVHHTDAVGGYIQSSPDAYKLTGYALDRPADLDDLNLCFWSVVCGERRLGPGNVTTRQTAVTLNLIVGPRHRAAIAAAAADRSVFTVQELAFLATRSGRALGPFGRALQKLIGFRADPILDNPDYMRANMDTISKDRGLFFSMKMRHLLGIESAILYSSEELCRLRLLPGPDCTNIMRRTELQLIIEKLSKTGRYFPYAWAGAPEINFSVGSPAFVAAEEGLSGPEDHGRWSDASLIRPDGSLSRDVVITMNKPLPDTFLLNLEGIAFGDNVGRKMPIRIGSKVYEITLQAAYQEAVMVTLDGIITSKITFTPPNPQSPGNGDPRHLAVGFKKLSIVDAAGDADLIAAAHVWAGAPEINFGIASPAFVAKEEGLSGHEGWGRWSDASLRRPDGSFSKDVVITMDKPLPNKFLLNLEVSAFGNNEGQEMPIRIGSQIFRIILQADPHRESIAVTLDGKRTSTITFTPPIPQLPGNGDTRELAVRFHKLSIVPQ